MMDKLLKFGKTIKVLYVEDNDAARESTLGMLENFFNDIVVGIDGKDGLEKYLEGNFDLIISDINMPKMNGIEMIEGIRKQDKNMPILILSAYNESGYFMDTIKIGVEGYILKPIDLNQLVEILGKTVERIQLRREIVSYQNSLEEKVQKQVVQLEQKNKEIVYLYYHDKLTSLPNRNSLIKTLKEENPYGIMLMDINNFSAINEIYGTDTGDKVLVGIANLLSDLNEDKYRFYRVGGDQFAFLNLKNGEFNFVGQKASDILEKIESTDVEATIAENETIVINISVKASMVSGVDPALLLKYAELTLHYAKKRNQHFLRYDENLDMHKQYKKELNAVQMVKRALAEDRLVPYFQQIIKNDKSSNYECLVRIKENDKVIPPFHFIEAVKKTKYYEELTKRMIEKSFDRFEGTDINFSINLSFEDISNKQTINFIEQKLKKTNIAKQVIFEILESENIENFTIVENFIQKVKKMGVRISIDDFGSGYSNFIHLLKLSPDILKIDGTLIKNVDKDKKSYTIVKTIVGFARDLGIQTVAEFVHSKEVYEVVKKLGVDGFQGYFFAEPVEFMEDNF